MQLVCFCNKGIKFQVFNSFSQCFYSQLQNNKCWKLLDRRKIISLEKTANVSKAKRIKRRKNPRVGMHLIVNETVEFESCFFTSRSLSQLLWKASLQSDNSRFLYCLAKNLRGICSWLIFRQVSSSTVCTNIQKHKNNENQNDFFLI